MSNNVKETVVQFGEGGFLRGSVDHFFHKLQEKGLYGDRIVVIQPIERGMCQTLTDQNYEYNLFLRGIDSNGVVDEHTRVTFVSRVLNPCTQYEKYIALAEGLDIRILVSNTTGAGTKHIGTEKLTNMLPKSYPAELCQFLRKRYKAGLKGLILLPCKPIGDDDDNPKKCVPQYTDLRELEDGFKDWVENESDFYNTLVDHTVTGYPRDEVEELAKQIGYEGKLIDIAEIFHLWMIGGHREDELLFREAGYNVVRIDDIRPYKKRKVRILDGGHTPMVLGTYLYGLETIGEYMKDEEVSSFLKKCIFEEIIPTVGNTENNRKFGAAVLERSSNPSIKHLLLSIALNSVSKFQVRALPTILEYREKFGKYPVALTFSMAALISFYCTDKASDGEGIL